MALLALELVESITVLEAEKSSFLAEKQLIYIIQDMLKSFVSFFQIVVR